MKLLIALFATAAAATTTAAAATATATSACAAENILQACLSTENDLLASCGTNDWDCKCNAYGNIVTCYNNCPGDARRSTAEGQQQIFCGYASQYPSSTTAATGTSTGTGTAAAKTTTGKTTATATTDASGSSATSAASAASATGTSGASAPAVHAGMLFAVGGAIAAML